MHSMDFDSGWVANFNGDFSGDVELRAPGHPTGITNVPFRVLQAIVAEKVRRTRISMLEDAADEDLLK